MNPTPKREEDDRSYFLVLLKTLVKIDLTLSITDKGIKESDIIGAKSNIPMNSSKTLVVVL